MNLEILYEDKHVLVVNKPSGLVVHADGKTREFSLAEWVLEKYPNMKGVGEPLTLSDGTVIDRPGIVHRLDRDTSGALVLARDQETFLFLKEQFQGRSIEKVYHAFVYGAIKENDGVIDRPIARSKKDFRLWSAQRGARGEHREAVTEYKVLKRRNDLTLVEVRPKTGRTHQIRVHLKAINHPVVCDKLYAPKRECVLGFGRVALHAKEIRFMLPGGKELRVEAPYPPDFRAAARSF